MSSTAFATTLFAFLLNIASISPALASVPPDAFPSPGLYRVDVEGTFGKVLGQQSPNVKMKTDGKTGTVVREDEVQGVKKTQTYAGQGPQTVCIAPPKAGQFMPPVAGCTTAPGVMGPGGLTMKSVCGGMETTIVIKKIDAKTWRFTTRNLQPAGLTAESATAGMSGMRMVLDNMLKNGTPEEKAQAKEALAKMPAAEAELKQAAALTKGMNLPKNKAVHEMTGVTTYTRIADNCEQKK